MTAPFLGWVDGEGHWSVVGGERKEGSSGPWGLQRREGVGSLRGQGWEPHFLAPWGEGAEAPSPRPPGAGWGGACLSHQLTMGSTSASRSKSSWISSVLPESLLATELGDGEFLEGQNRRLQRAAWGRQQEGWTPPPGKPCLHRGSSLRPTLSAFLRVFEAQELEKALKTSCDALHPPL